MNDKEMAEEYTVQFGFGSDCNNITSHDANEAIAQAFLQDLEKEDEKNGTTYGKTQMTYRNQLQLFQLYWKVEYLM